MLYAADYDVGEEHIQDYSRYLNVSRLVHYCTTHTGAYSYLQLESFVIGVVLDPEYV